MGPHKDIHDTNKHNLGARVLAIEHTQPNEVKGQA